MKTTTFSKIANKYQQPAATTALVEQQQQQQQHVEYKIHDYVLPSSKSSNCFLNYTQNNNNNNNVSATIIRNNWHSDSNLYSNKNTSKIINDKDSIISNDYDDNDEIYDDEDDDDDVDDDELVFSDHVGLFKSLTHNNNNNNNSNNDINNYSDSITTNNNNNNENNLTTTTSLDYINDNSKAKLNYILSSNECYKLCRLSNEQLNYDLDSINNWSMRFSNEFTYLQQYQHQNSNCNSHNYNTNHQQQQQQQQHQQQSLSSTNMYTTNQITTTTNTSISNKTGSYSSQTTTSWNKLKKLKSNQNLQSSSTSTTTSSLNETPLIKLYKSTKQSVISNDVTQQSLFENKINNDNDNSSLYTGAITDDEKRARKKYTLSKSPTITFGELRHRNNKLVFSTTSTTSSSSSMNLHQHHHNPKQSIGTQYPPHLMDQSIQTSTILNNNINNNHKVNAGLQITEADILVEQAKFSDEHTFKNKNENIKFFYKSLPDLTFLSSYCETKTTKTINKKDEISKINNNINTNTNTNTNTIIMIKPSPIGDNEIKLLISSSSIDKQRKTLKSIKRYRQTKQNTEPCCPIVQQIIQQENFKLEDNKEKQQQVPQRKLRTSESFTSTKTPILPEKPKQINQTTKQPTTTTTTTNGSNSSSSSSSSGYVSADKIANVQTTTLATIKPLNRQCDNLTNINNNNNINKNNNNTPLKSCLKRKDSASSNSTTELTSISNRISTIRRYNSLATASNERIRLNSKELINYNDFKIQINAMPIFIQSIGWLFTCNLKSLKNYPLFKKLKNEYNSIKYMITIDTSKFNIIKEESDDDDDDDDKDEDEDDEDENDEEEVDVDNNVNDTSSPYIRLRYDCKIRNAKSDNDLRYKKYVSFSECISHHTITPQNQSTQSSPLHEQASLSNIEKKFKNNLKEPLLQYSTLIEMLNNRKIINNNNNNYINNKVKRQDSIENLRHKLVIKTNNNNNNYIDADSISLASLTESPPNEFKFSDEDLVNEMPSSSSSSKTEINKSLNYDINNYFTSPQQQQYFNELKIIIFQLNEIFIKEQELNNEKQIIINILLKDNLCLILFNLLKDNLKLILNEPIIKQNANSEFKINELRYEQLCKLFQYLLSIKFMQQNNNNNNNQNDKQFNNPDEPIFLLNEASPKQKFEAFIYFFLNIKKLPNIFDYINNDKLLINKFYDLTNLNLNNSSLIYLNEIIYNEFIIQIKLLSKFNFKLKYLFQKTTPPSSTLTSITSTTKQQQTNDVIINHKQITNNKHSPSSSISTPLHQIKTPVISQTLPSTQNQNKNNNNNKIYTGNHYNNNNNNNKKAPSPPKSLQITSSNNNNNNNNHSSNSIGFNLKTISKKFNIKSWFTSNTHSSKNHHHHQQSNKTTVASNDIMKHSFSEPMINEFNVNFNPNSSKL